VDHTTARSQSSDPSALIELLGTHRDVIVPLAIGEPQVLLDAVDAAGPGLEGVRVHQMHALRDRPYLHGAYPGLRHVAYFLSPVTRPAFHAGAATSRPPTSRTCPTFCVTSPARRW